MYREKNDCNSPWKRGETAITSALPQSCARVHCFEAALVPTAQFLCSPEDSQVQHSAAAPSQLDEAQGRGIQNLIGEAGEKQPSSRAQVCWQCPVLTLGVAFLVLAADTLRPQEGGREPEGRYFPKRIQFPLSLLVFSLLYPGRLPARPLQARSCISYGEAPQ